MWWSRPMADLDHTCAALNVDEPLAGSAQQATAHVFVEHLGPWGAGALDALDPAYAAKLSTVAAAVGLVRRPGAERDSDTGMPPRPRVIVATNGLVVTARTDGAPRVADLVEVLAALSRGEVPNGWTPEPWVVLVCTHAKRDACCARLGRPLLDALVDATAADRLWETTHLGGHRFAPTCLALPSQVAYGRVPADRVAELVAAIEVGEVVPDLMRGRTTYEPALQVAEIAARERLGVRGVLELTSYTSLGARTTSTWRGQGTVTVTVEERPGRPRKVSCAKDGLEAKPVYEVVALSPEEPPGAGEAGS